MSRLIDADALLEVLESTRYGHIQRLKDLITNAPTVQRIEELESKLKIAVDALKLYSANKRIGLNATIALKQIEATS